MLKNIKFYDLKSISIHAVLLASAFFMLILKLGYPEPNYLSLIISDLKENKLLFAIYLLMFSATFFCILSLLNVLIFYKNTEKYNKLKLNVLFSGFISVLCFFLVHYFYE